MSTLAPTLSPTAYTVSQKTWLAAGAAVFMALLVLMAHTSIAGTVNTSGYDASAVNDVWDLLKQFVQGPIGRIITLLIIVVGVAAAILTQSLGAFAVGVGAALGLNFAPEIIHGLLSATLQASDFAVAHSASVSQFCTAIGG